MSGWRKPLAIRLGEVTRGRQNRDDQDLLGAFDATPPSTVLGALPVRYVGFGKEAPYECTLAVFGGRACLFHPGG